MAASAERHGFAGNENGLIVDEAVSVLRIARPAVRNYCCTGVSVG